MQPAVTSVQFCCLSLGTLLVFYLKVMDKDQMVAQYEWINCYRTRKAGLSWKSSWLLYLKWSQKSYLCDVYFLLVSICILICILKINYLSLRHANLHKKKLRLLLEEFWFHLSVKSRMCNLKTFSIPDQHFVTV